MKSQFSSSLSNIDYSSKKQILLGIICLNLLACDRGVPVVGFDEQGQARSFQVYDERFSAETTDLLNEVSQSVNAGAIQSNDLNTWGIHKITVGIGAKAKINAPAATKSFSIQPRIRFVFTR